MPREERPIDRGWAWMVCGGVFVNSIFFSGPLRSYGILFVEVTRRFNASSTTSSILLAMISVGLSITSPLATSLGERYGQRFVTITGSVLMFLAAFLTSFATDVIYVTVIFGVFTGLGLGCLFAPSLIMIGYYFKKRRSLANGIGSAGGSVGQLTIPVLFTYLLQTYSFQGSLWIFAALMLHIIPASLLFRPVTSYKPISQPIDSIKKHESENGKDDLSQDKGLTDNLMEVEDGKRSISLMDITSDGHDDNIKICKAKSVPNGINANHANLSRASSLYMQPHQPPPDATEPAADDKEKSCRSGVDFCCKLYDWSLFKNPVFLLYCLSQTTGMNGYGMACLYLPAFAMDKGAEPYEAAALISIAGAITFFGRIGGGWFADFQFIERYKLSSICLLIIGIYAILLPYFTLVLHYAAMVIFALIVGFFGGMSVAQLVSVVIDLLGIQHMSSGMGLSFMLCGLTGIPLPLIIGLIVDATDTYDYAMVVCGVLLCTGSVTQVLAGLLARKRQARETER